MQWVLWILVIPRHHASNFSERMKSTRKEWNPLFKKWTMTTAERTRPSTKAKGSTEEGCDGLWEWSRVGIGWDKKTPEVCCRVRKRLESLPRRKAWALSLGRRDRRILVRRILTGMWEGFPGTGFGVCVGPGLTTTRSSDDVIIGLIALVWDHWLVLVVCRFVNIAEHTIGQGFRVATVHNYNKGKKTKI